MNNFYFIVYDILHCIDNRQNVKFILMDMLNDSVINKIKVK